MLELQNSSSGTKLTFRGGGFWVILQGLTFCPGAFPAPFLKVGFRETSD